jgi:hypothetical protein
VFREERALSGDSLENIYHNTAASAFERSGDVIYKNERPAAGIGSCRLEPYVGMQCLEYKSRAACDKENVVSAIKIPKPRSVVLPSS